MENGKINYVAKDFNRTFYSAPVNQTIWLERGKGFTAEQAANLIQGRSVYRDDTMNMGGETYKAWVKLDFDKGKDRFQNYSTNQYLIPCFADQNEINLFISIGCKICCQKQKNILSPFLMTQSPFAINFLFKASILE